MPSNETTCGGQDCKPRDVSLENTAPSGSSKCSHCLLPCREEAALQGLNEEYQGAIALYRQLLSSGVPTNPPPQPTPFAASQPMHGAPPPTYQAPAPTYQPAGAVNPTYRPAGGANPTYQPAGGVNPTYQPAGGVNPTYQPPGSANPTYQPPGGANLTYQPPGGIPPAYQPGSSYHSIGTSGGDVQQAAWVSACRRTETACMTLHPLFLASAAGAWGEPVHASHWPRPVSEVHTHTHTGIGKEC